MDEDIRLIVTDDDAGHTQLIVRNLRKAGIDNEIITFDDGEDLLNFLNSLTEDKLQTAKFLIILDIRMPRIDGIEALKAIKDDDRLRVIPIIMFTTTDDPCEIEKCYRNGCNSYITKPIDYGKFVELIERLGYFLKIQKYPILKTL